MTTILSNQPQLIMNAPECHADFPPLEHTVGISPSGTRGCLALCTNYGVTLHRLNVYYIQALKTATT